ncbi:amidase [Saccharolobus shibatae]|uniref:Aspartyl-tRNA(Asn) amidotransferase subunit A, Glutamyl-tRNA(Gln) amidotransferase subunit A n=1 Tax=Saccharolobus shibatae TaxID=2286 RepID=A0A8F5C1J5_9CREN|nr:amidase [Saccharolobus shibatae]QXJ35437.1 Aspartyl-tRNA(Asn) amidotransferase subunit A, Glutamyl-tRNA(Gln) amidotransferase subunit A [Saccharolobus shibatae]
MNLDKVFEELLSSNKNADLVNLIYDIMRGNVSPSEKVYESLEKIREENSRFNSYITIISPSEEALRILDKIIKSNNMKFGNLIGVPIAVKDNIYTKNVLTTIASRIYKDFIPSYDASVIVKLKEEDGIVIGKTNLHALASGVSNVSSDFGPVRNPHDPNRISGGSSGGSAVTVAVGSVKASIGTDTFGSIRIPASLCGIVGYKPSYGLISNRGLYPTAWSFDTVGFLTRSVIDSAYLAGIFIDGIDALRINKGIDRRLRLGYLVDEETQLEVEREFIKLLPVLESNGIEIVKLDMDLKTITEIARTIRLSEGATIHYELFMKRERDYPRDTAELIRMGMKVPAYEYIRALKLREAMLIDFLKLDVDAIIMPTTPIVAPEINEVEKDEIKFRNILTKYIALPNLFGSPAVSLPAGKINSLPWGLQIVGRPKQDESLLRISKKIEDIIQNYF